MQKILTPRYLLYACMHLYSRKIAFLAIVGDQEVFLFLFTHFFTTLYDDVETNPHVFVRYQSSCFFFN